MTRVAVLDDWQRVARACADWSALEAQAQVHFFEPAFADEDDATAQLLDFDIVLATRERTRFPRSLIERLPAMRMFGLTGMRAGQIDLACLQARGVTVCYTSGGPGVESTAEMALGLMLGAARSIPRADACVRAGRFQRGIPPGLVLAGKTLGLVGLGRIGSRVARYGNALGMDVVAWSPHLTAERAAQAGVRHVAKDVLFSAADVVSVHLVLSPATRGIVGVDELQRMKEGAILVNTSRAPLVDADALAAAVRTGRIVAALDVYEQEPLPADHPLAGYPNTVLTPHLGYAVTEVYQVFYRECVENALAFLAGDPIRVLPPQ
jgi:D-3-phosphoglycerate dehydrogenase